jgi:hypothetical protein
MSWHESTLQELNSSIKFDHFFRANSFNIYKVYFLVRMASLLPVQPSRSKKNELARIHSAPPCMKHYISAATFQIVRQGTT